MQVTLFAAAQDVREALAAVDEITGELNDAYAGSLALFEKKGVACVAYAVEEAAAVAAMEVAVQQIVGKLKARQQRLQQFREYIAACMGMTGTDRIEDEHGLFRAVLHRCRDVAVEIDDGAQFPAELCNAPKPPEPSKRLIRLAIEAGEPIAGARLVRRDRLSIN